MAKRLSDKARDLLHRLVLAAVHDEGADGELSEHEVAGYRFLDEGNLMFNFASKELLDAGLAGMELGKHGVVAWVTDRGVTSHERAKAAGLVGKPLAYAKMTTLRGEPWCCEVFDKQYPGVELQPLMTEQAVENARFQAEKLADWSSDYDPEG